MQFFLRTSASWQKETCLCWSPSTSRATDADRAQNFQSPAVYIAPLRRLRYINTNTLGRRSASTITHCHIKAYLKKVNKKRLILTSVSANSNEMPKMFLVRGLGLAARSFKMVGNANKTRYGEQLQHTKTPLTFLSIWREYLLLLGVRNLRYYGRVVHGNEMLAPFSSEFWPCPRLSLC